MPAPFEVTYQDIERLSPEKLVELLQQLLYLEAREYNIPANSVHVPQTIDVADGGEDGRIQWQGRPENTAHIPCRFCLYQSKAGTLRVSDCRNIILKEQSREERRRHASPEMKPKVQEAFDQCGLFVLFLGTSCVQQKADQLRERMLEAVHEAGSSHITIDSISVIDANQIAAWANRYLSTIIAVKEWAGIGIPYTLYPWQVWSGYPQYQNRYIDTDELSEQRRILREHLASPKKCARITGFSGIGKTRFALETFRPDGESQEDNIRRRLSDAVVYCDAAVQRELPALLQQWRTQGIGGILVVDNCDERLHRRLQNEIEHRDSQLSLLTLDCDPPRDELPSCHEVSISPIPNDCVAAMLKESFPTLAPEDLHRIVAFTMGFPKMAVLLSRYRSENPDLSPEEMNLGLLRDRELTNRLIWGRGEPDSEAMRVLSACSLFRYLGVEEDLIRERDFVAAYMCGVSPETFYRHCQTFIGRGVLERRGRYLHVVPHPLALRLAADWWTGYPTDKVPALISEAMAQGVAVRLADRMKFLHDCDSVRKSVEILCSRGGMFRDRSILDSESGSQLFSALAEAHPRACIDALTSATASMERQDLIDMEQGRRHLVWALEKLCFWRDTFPDAVRLLLRFAAAENEEFGNNATNQFFQLFHIVLAGTQASLDDRLLILEEGVESSDRAEKEVAVQALKAALKTRSFSRVLGAEWQGSRPELHEYSPTRTEITRYRRGALAILGSCAEDDDLRDLGKSVVVQILGGMIRVGLIDDLNSTLTRFCEQLDYFWPELRAEFQLILRVFDELPKPRQEWCKAWIARLVPKTLPQKQTAFVDAPTFDIDSEGVDHFGDGAITLAHELSTDPASLIDILPLLCVGSQMAGFAFGRVLGEELADPVSVIERVIEISITIPKNERNFNILSGLLSGIRDRDPGFTDQILDRFAEDQELIPFLVGVTTLIGPNNRDLHRILNLVRNGLLPVDGLKYLIYKGSLRSLTFDEIKAFCDALIELPDNQGLSAAVEIIALLNGPRCAIPKDQIVPYARLLLCRSGVLSAMVQGYPHSHGDLYQLKSLIATVLISSEEGAEATPSGTSPRTDPSADLCAHLARELLELSDNSREAIHYHELELRAIFRLIFDHNRGIVLPIYWEAQLSEDSAKRTWAMALAGSSPFSLISEASPVLTVSDYIGICETETQRAPPIIASMVPVTIMKDGRPTLHPVARFLLDRFGDREDVLKKMSTRLDWFSWKGSLIPYYRQVVTVMQELEDHPRPQVRIWARENLRAMQKAIGREQNDEDEDRIRFS